MHEQLTVEAVGLTKRYGSTPVLDGVDVRAERGSVVALLGPNGAGKTTTVRILATLTRADGGTARVAGCDVERDRREVRRRISLTGQFTAVDELLTGRENLELVGRLRGLGRRAASRVAGELLERFDLAGAAGRRAGTFSGGMRRRLDLAAGLIGDVEVLFLDEPTTGLDLTSRHAMWDIVTERAAAGATVVLTTQYLEEADRLADRVTIIDRGRVVVEGTAEQLVRTVAEQRLELRFTDRRAFETAERTLGARVIHADQRSASLALATDGSAAQVRALLDEVDPGRDAVTAFDVQRTTLEDAFLALTGRPMPDQTATDPSSTDAEGAPAHA
ncbi:MAG: ATP-binding cassette domain-containing protein [Actinomycetota bacterium]|nr:ATP-binding cassette domain-containing protein [Actinomycetota bacterium]